MLKVERNYGEKNFNELFNEYLEQKTKYLKFNLTKEKEERYNKEYYSSTYKNEGVDRDE